MSPHEDGADADGPAAPGSGPLMALRSQGVSGRAALVATRGSNCVQVLKAGAVYFALVFAAGFVLGPIRILWAVPRFGERIAELMEAPLMLVVIILAARWTGRRFVTPPSPSRLLGVGFIALGLLLLAEFTVLWFRGLTIAEYFATRDPVGGAVYVVMLLIYAMSPLLMARK